MRLGIDAFGLSNSQLHTGIGQYTAHLLRALPQIAPDLSIIAYGGPGEPRPPWLPGTVLWHPVGARVPAKLTALYTRLRILPGLVRMHRLDIFHAPAVHVRPSFPPVPVVSCPLVVTVHDLIPLTFYRMRLPLKLRVFYRWNLRRALRADAVIAVSEAGRDQILQRTRIDAHRLAVVYNGVDFDPNPDAEPLRKLGIESPYVLYAGSYEPRKNLASALSAFALVAQSPIPHRLIAVVERQSGHAASVHRQLESLGLQDRVCLVHSLPESELRALYTYASALFFPSLAEGFGLPPLQAAACGVPVVVSDLPVLHEVLGGAAVYVDPRSVPSMADGLSEALFNEPLRARLRTLGPQIAGRYTLERTARHHLATYERLAAASPLSHVWQSDAGQAPS